MNMSFNQVGRWVSSRYIGPAAMSLAVMVLVISELGFYRLMAIGDDRQASVDLQMTVGSMRSALLSMESAGRGYMLTGRIDYLQPYRDQERSLQDLIRLAEAAAVQNVMHRQLLLDLVELARRKHSEMQTVLELYERGDREAAIDLTLTDMGRELMDQVGEVSDRIIRQETAHYTSTSYQRDQVLRWSRTGIWVLVVLCIGGAVALMRLGRSLEQERRVYLLQLHAERDRLDEEVGRRTEEVISLARHMERVREDERAMLARELHDELGGLLTAAKLDLARIRKRIHDDTGAKQQLVEHLGQSLDAGIALKRRIIEDLRPSSLSNLGLRHTLQIQCKEFAQRSELPVDVQVDEVTLPPERALAVYRLVQEALTNVAKYAQARRVQVSLQRQEDHVRVTVQDDGLGFDPAAVKPAGSHGLQGMRFRIHSCGGDVTIRSAPGKGTTVQAVLPL